MRSDEDRDYLRCLPQGVCDPSRCESDFTCPQDCQRPCTGPPSQIEAQRDFIFSRISVLTNNVESPGLDVDGYPPVKDVKLSSVAHLLSAYSSVSDPDEHFQRVVDTGELVIVARVWWAPFQDGIAETVIQLRYGRLVEAPPRFDGSDIVEILPASDEAPYVCGSATTSWFGGRNDIETGSFPLPLTIAGQASLIAPVEHLRLEGTLDATGWRGVVLGAGVPYPEVERLVFPGWVAAINQAATAEAPPSPLPNYEGWCDVSVPGCDPLPNDCVVDGVMTVDELRCHSVLSEMFAPDLDDRALGNEPFTAEQPGLVSVGFQLWAVPAVVH